MSDPRRACVSARMLTVLSWNLLADCHIRPSWYRHVLEADLAPATRWPRVIAALTSSDADVVCLQEVAAEQLPAIRAALSPRQLAHSPHLGEGVLVASRVPFLGVESIRVGRKTSLVVTLADGTRVASVHLTWSGPPDAGSPDRPGLDQLDALLRAAPDVIAGDFNAFPDWPERRRLASAGYVDIGPGAPTCNVNGWLQALDTVYVAPGWSGTAAALEAIAADTPMPSARFPSDHLPVQVRAWRG